MLMVLQLAIEVWDSSGELSGRCLQQLGAKRTIQMSYGTQVAGSALFFQGNVIFGYGVFRGSSNRVFGSKGCEKDVQTVCISWYWLVFKFFMFLTSFLFLK